LLCSICASAGGVASRRDPVRGSGRVQRVARDVRLATAPAGACDILNPVLGTAGPESARTGSASQPQGLLDIVAQSGAGNLLGNLLCAVAGLLDGASAVGGILNGIAALLNPILAILG
jgi:hypothetical protein